MEQNDSKSVPWDQRGRSSTGGYEKWSIPHKPSPHDSPHYLPPARFRPSARRRRQALLPGGSSSGDGTPSPAASRFRHGCHAGDGPSAQVGEAVDEKEVAGNGEQSPELGMAAPENPWERRRENLIGMRKDVSFSGCRIAWKARILLVCT